MRMRALGEMSSNPFHDSPHLQPITEWCVHIDPGSPLQARMRSWSSHSAGEIVEPIDWQKCSLAEAGAGDSIRRGEQCTHRRGYDSNASFCDTSSGYSLDGYISLPERCRLQLQQRPYNPIIGTSRWYESVICGLLCQPVLRIEEYLLLYDVIWSARSRKHAFFPRSVLLHDTDPPLLPAGRMYHNLHTKNTADHLANVKIQE